MKKLMYIFTLITVTLIAVLSFARSSDITHVIAREHPTDNQLQALVDGYSEREIKGTDASITSDALLVYEGETVTSHALDDDLFFVSFAPYVDTTHPCEIHSLSGCQGELAHEDVNVTIETPDGKVLFEDTINTGTNGFIDLWVTRGQEYKIHLQYKDKQVRQSFTSYADSPTCITTMQLH